MLQLLARAKPHDLGLGRVQPQSPGSRPLVDVMDTDSKAVNGYPYLAGLTRSYKLGCHQHTGGCADHDTRSTVQAQQCTVYSVQHRPQDGTLRNTKQKQLLAG